MQKIGFSFILFPIFLFYVIKEKAALELEFNYKNYPSLGNRVLQQEKNKK
jgi:hypothetical protein